MIPPVVPIALGVALALSLAGNAWLFRRLGEAQVEIGTTRQLAADTKAAADACTVGVENLEKAARRRQADLLGAMTRIGPQVAAQQKAAIAALNAKPDDPKDLCGSLERYWRQELGKGKQP